MNTDFPLRSAMAPGLSVRTSPGLLMKRAFDIVVSAVMLVLLLPVLAIVAAAVMIGLGSPIYFRQWRPGLGGKPFLLYKFRTMRLGGTTDDERLTKLGNFLRSASLDELPQLWNVLKGDMSLIGPRPLMMEYLPRYSREQARRHEMRPGITGWAQVNGRNTLDWGERFRMDVWYIDHWSPLLDFKILLRTVGRVLSRSGITAPGSATMTEFLGNAPPPERVVGSSLEHDGGCPR